MAILLGVVSTALGFTVPVRTTQNGFKSRLMAPLQVLPESLSLFDDSTTDILISALQKKDPETAKGEFFFFLGAGSGAGGIGLSQVPRIYKELSEIRALEGEGPSEGGKVIDGGLASLLYPTIYEADLAKVLKNVPSCEQISKQGTNTSYLASKGYIAREDFIGALKSKKCNPLAACALFDAISGGSSAIISPILIDEKLTGYRSATNPAAAVTGDLQACTTVKLSAYAGLAFLLSIVFGLIISNGIDAFL
eukprot:CAMPEP_0195319906 /NCGR_PEP_ID=MMETSP0708-20121125/5782_1 /TAXON_ID=33640 /ORGANISM="Asterionellopsis glacialis, Strain CCMP134" /LENGTH=250 /DNA_ID=CAMNT_0040386205 /DNA_START=100 /DNA_END=852 /DNA_ORIENTATION=-